MGRIRFSAAILSILLILFGCDASSRVLLDKEKVSPSPLPDQVAIQKTTVNESSSKPPADPNKPDGSIHPPPPSKLEDNSTIHSGADRDDAAEHGNSDPESKDEGNDAHKGGDKPTNNSMDKKVIETCDSSSAKCSRKNLVACLLQHSGKDEKKLSIVIQNIGENDFTVKISGSPALQIDKVTVSKNNSTKIDLPTKDQNVTEIILDAGTEECILHLTTPAPYSDLFPQFSVYDIHLTPIHGLYVLAGTIVLGGASWACCKFRKREKREGSGVPYQQLEMSAQTQNDSPSDSRSPDGWDDEWDDDWNDEDSTRPPEKYSTRASVSSNGLASRAPKKDGWEESWED